MPSWEAGKPHSDFGQVVVGFHFGLHGPFHVEAWSKLSECFQTNGDLTSGQGPDHCGIFGPFTAVYLDRVRLVSAGRGHCSFFFKTAPIPYILEF